MTNIGLPTSAQSKPQAPSLSATLNKADSATEYVRAARAAVAPPAPAPDPQKQSLFSAVESALVSLFGGAKNKSEYLGDAPKSGYPSAQDAKQGLAAGVDYGTGFENLIREGRVRDATGLRGDLDRVADIIAKQKVKPTPAAVDMLAAGLLAANRNAIAGLGFDPNTISVEQSGAELNLGGFFVPQRDVLMVNSKTPSAVVHESIHRGLQKLRDSGMLTPRERQFVDGQEERIVRYLMIKDMGDVEGVQGPASKEQRDDAQRYFDMNPTTEPLNLLSSIQAKAQQLVASRRPGGPR